MIEPQTETNITPTQPSQPKSSSPLLMIFLIVLVVFSLVGMGYLYWQNQQLLRHIALLTSQQKTSPDVEEPVVVKSTDNSNIETYSSQKLGIKLEHTSQQTVKEVGQRIYVSDDSDYLNGQYVEVFNKDPNLSFQKSIEMQLLKNVDKKICWVEAKSLDDGLQSAEIVHPQADFDSPELTTYMKTCGEDYTQTNGLRYFSYDSRYPDKFLFFNIGQYVIIVGDYAWQQTVNIVNK